MYDGLILRRTPINNTVKLDHAHAAIQTYDLLVQGQTTPVPSYIIQPTTNIDAEAALSPL